MTRTWTPEPSRMKTETSPTLLRGTSQLKVITPRYLRMKWPSNGGMKKIIRHRTSVTSLSQRRRT